MKIKDNPQLRKTAEDFISLGQQLDFFDSSLANEFHNKILNFDVNVDNSIPGDAKTTSASNLITINMSRLVNQEDKDLVLFHEFTHICSDIHNDLFPSVGRRSYLSLLRANIKRIKGSNSYQGLSIENDDNPYNYLLYGGILLDEVIAENVATEMVKLKYKAPSILKTYNRQFGRNSITYQSHFKYYGIGEELANEFSKTLFLKEGSKNLHGLCRESFKKNFVYSLIRQHNERRSSLSALVDELSLMGVIAHSEEQLNGHLLNQRPISSDTVYTSYYNLKNLIRTGYEDREFIPSNIPFPDFE